MFESTKTRAVIQVATLDLDCNLVGIGDRVGVAACFAHGPELADGIRVDGLLACPAQGLPDPCRGRLTPAAGQLLDLGQLVVVEQHLQPLGHGSEAI